jgi:GT2 family glycosyltransferase
VEKVSIVIAARRSAGGLERLLNSLFEITSHPDFETILVEATDSGGGLPGERPIIRISTPPGPFNRARSNNVGASKAAGQYLLFLDQDVEIVESDWIEQLVLHANLPRVSVVGPMLVRPDGLVDQAGVAIGLRDPASPMSPDAPADSDGYYGSLPCAHEVSAISSACMLVRRADFEATGGFNDFYCAQYEDFDLCQRLAAKSLSIVYTPRPRVITHQTPATKRVSTDIVDRALFVDCWYDELRRGDPYFNPGFGHQKATYSPASWRERVYRATSPHGQR